MNNEISENKTGHTFKLKNFEGPLDLLLFLIRENEIDIYDIPIASITKQYLEYIDLMQMLDLEVAGEYLVMAATLMRIKSRMLLPRDETEDETESEDPRQELVRQLLEYQKFKEVASVLSEREESQRSVFLRSSPPLDEDGETEEPLQQVSLFDLLKAFREALQRQSEPPFYPIMRPVMSVEERIAEISARLEGEGKILFHDLLPIDFSRAALVVTFIAILEMIRSRTIVIKQTRLFGDIWIYQPAR
jgi:segregation and condensation protein A